MDEKIYYSIGEVADMFNVNASLIRYWESEFTILRPRKNKKGNRLFTPKDIENLKKIYSLVKERGYTLQGAKDALRAKEKLEAASEENLVDKLKGIKRQLLELRDSI